jgi:hypothetical protein
MRWPTSATTQTNSDLPLTLEVQVEDRSHEIRVPAGFGTFTL